ncbi:BamA/TamA family outer membrane protein [Calothrix sp. 336/3]|uniref:BamA/TamA family outer membrane protein n=1 Tax=Calothrix sp. 336/3 TaxID=1337936 RepID=UPI0004E458A3|nr:BamA/TamA family outer membrane protein [Calothrix sp. 336/3]AKG22380.1 surface antigen (D15) [Calothrix sp. 336/3]
MRASSATILTLTSLTVGNLTQQAIAAPNSPNSDTSAVSEDVVVPVKDDTPREVEFAVSPETIPEQQFSRNSPSVKTPTPQKAVENPAPVKTPTPQKAVVILETPSTVSPTPSFSPPPLDNNLVVTATEVKILGATEELQEVIRSVIKTQVGGETSQNQLQKDMAAILDTGLFATANLKTNATREGLEVVYQVEPVIVRSLQLSGAKALTQEIALQSFQPLLSQPISPGSLKQAVAKINKWYSNNGYKLGRVLSIKPSKDGMLTVNVAEGVVGDIKFRFLGEDNEAVDSQGKPVKGRTKPDFLYQQIKFLPGQVYQEKLVREDVQQLYQTGLFETIQVAFEGDANKTDVIYLLKETSARSLNFGGNYNRDQGILGTFSYRDRNFGGINDTFSVDVQAGRQDLGFDVKYSSPYRPSEPNRIGYSINAFRQRGLSDTLDDLILLPNGDKIREGKIGASLNLQRPIDGWDANLGFNYTRTSIRDRAGEINSVDARGNSLTLSGTGIDDLATVSLSATKDHRDNPLNPTQGYFLSLSTEQSIPLGQGNISMNRIKANYSEFRPVKLFESAQPQVFAFNLQAGTVLGDLPPYDAFNLGGSNSVRGYDAGRVGSGRTYVLASAEYRFPVWQALGGIVFADFASDLGSGDTVLGNPAGMRNKPGTGFGYGAGIRFDSPLGLIRADYGISDQGESRFHFGIGQRF